MMKFLTPETVKPEFASKIINIIFKRKIVCDNQNITESLYPMGNWGRGQGAGS